MPLWAIKDMSPRLEYLRELIVDDSYNKEIENKLMIEVKNSAGKYIKEEITFVKSIEQGKSYKYIFAIS